jgi:hypothetical protein
MCGRVRKIMNLSVCVVTCLHDSFVRFSLSHISVSSCISVGFQVLTVVVMKSHILWDIMACGLLKVNQHVVSVFMVEE